MSFLVNLIKNKAARYSVNSAGDTALAGAAGNFPIGDGVTAGFEYFPRCKMFLRCRESSGTTMRNEISGTDLIVGSAITRSGNAARIYSRPIFSQVPEVFGDTIAAGTHTVMAFAVFKPAFNNNGFTMTGATEPNDHLHAYSFNATGVIGADITDNASILTTHSPSAMPFPLGSDVAIAVAYTPGGSAAARFYKYDGTTFSAESQTTIAAGGGATTNNPDFNGWKFVAGGSTSQYVDCYAAYVFRFAAGVPADIETALRWMTDKALAGAPAIYPGWLGQV